MTVLHIFYDTTRFLLPQVCDSDTKLDSLATVELVKVLESDHKYGAVGGDVMILNLKESYISFMSSLRYWMAFNIERACQSFFNCVSCISGPLGKEIKFFIWDKVMRIQSSIVVNCCNKQLLRTVVPC